MDVTLDPRTGRPVAFMRPLPGATSRPLATPRPPEPQAIDPRPDGHPRPGDPSPAEIEEAKAEIRRARKSG